MPLDNQILRNKSTLFSALEALKNNINYNLNCIKVATVDTFFPENLTVSCRISNKRLIKLKDDGNQVLQDYPLIYAKVHYIGWGDVGITYPIESGMEGFLLFNDREMETWFLTGQSGNLAYDRCHDLSDAIFICGLHSMPNMIELVEACLNLFYKNSNIQIADTSITHNSTTHTFNGNLVINGNLQVNGSINATGDIVANGISLLSHVHGGVTGGTGTTGVPQ